MTSHYIAMAGLHGCLPNSCEVYDTYQDAVDSLVSLHELGKKRAAALKRDGSLELNIGRDDNEYCEVEKCACSEPQVHSDSES